MDFLIGTLTRMGGAGIGRVRLENDRLRLLWTNGSLTDPNWQSLGPNGRIFSVSSDMPEPMRGCVNELKISETGMDVISRQATEGNGPCALSFSADGRFLLCANYGTGSLTVFPLTQKGIGPCRQRIQHEGQGPHPTRQAGPHIHQVTRIPTLPGSFCVVDLGIDALVVIGGDGSLSGARIFASEYNFPIVGMPGTIDNDLFGTDTTIGYDTALNTIMEAVDKIRDTASSHERLFFIEVMGREAGFLALNGAIASGAEAAIIPEIATEVDQLSELIGNGFRKSKNSSIVLVAESELTGGATGLAERVKNEFPQYDVRVTILGHIQRGGSPSASDRILASRMGEASINALLEGQRNVMIGIQNDELVYIPFSKAIKNQKPINRDLLNTIKILSI